MDDIPLSKANLSERVTSIPSDTEGRDPIAELWREYNSLVDTLKKQRYRRDPVLLMRLSLVMRDLGLCKVSPP